MTTGLTDVGRRVLELIARGGPSGVWVGAEPDPIFDAAAAWLVEQGWCLQSVYPNGLRLTITAAGVAAAELHLGRGVFGAPPAS